MLLFAAVSGPSGQVPRVTFGATTSIDLGVQNPIGHAVADLNQDGHADLIVTPAINMFTGDGTGSFALARSTAFANASALAAADFNGDGAIDLAVASQSAGDPTCGTSPGVGIFGGPNLSSASTCISAGDGPIAVQAADYDGDGLTDLAIVSATAQGLRIFKGQGNGAFTQVMTAETGGSVPGSFINATAIAPPVDLDGNGTLDLVVAHAAGVRIFLGNGDGTFRDGGGVGTANAASAVAIGDLNGDGIPDIASVESSHGALIVDFAVGNGTFATQTIATIGTDLTDVVIADIDSDGRADLLVAHEGGGTVRMFFGNGDGTFVANPPLALSARPKFLVVRDWDEDGDPDLGIIDAGIGGANATLWIVRQDRAASSDATPPTVALTSPAANAHVSGTVAITAAAFDNVGVTDVEFYAGSSLIGKSAGPNYIVSWNTAALANGPVTVTARALDAALNASPWATLQVIVDNTTATNNTIDTTPPVITVPASATIEATGTTGTPFTYTASAVDAVDGVVPVTCTPPSGSVFAFGATTVTCTAQDTHGNGASATFTVIVTDTTAPVVTAPAAISVAATEVGGARGNVTTSSASQLVSAFLSGASAIDVRDPAPVREVPQATINASAIAATVSTLFPIGTTNVVFRFHDASGNVGSASSAITVLPPVGGVVDTPNARVVATDARNAPQPITVSFATVTQPGLLTANSMTAPAPPAAGFKFARGVVDIVTTAIVAPPIQVCLQGAAMTAQDRVLHYEGNAWVDVTTVDPAMAWADVTTLAPPAELCATVTSLSPFAVITTANHPPTANAGPAKTVQATSAAGASVTLTGTGADVDGDTLSFHWTERGIQLGTIPTLTSVFSIGSHLLTLTVSDGQDSAMAATMVTVRDTTPPSITAPANATLEATGPTGAVFTYTASATDIVDGAVAVTCTPPSGSTFPIGTTTVTCRATDRRNNTATKTFSVTVTDSAAPVITVPANATLEATSPSGAAFTYTASALDAIDGSVAVTCTSPSGSTFPPGATTVNCTATDAHGNGAARSFTVTVTDTTAPVLTLPANATVTTTDPAGAIFTYDATASDLVDGSGAVSLVHAGNLAYEGTFRVPAGFFRGPNLTPWQFDRAMFDYGGTSLAFNQANNSLFIVGHDQAQLVAEISIPLLTHSLSLGGLNTANMLQPFTDATDGRLSLVSSDPLNPPDVTIKIGGLLPYQNRLFSTGYIYYDGRSSQRFSHLASGLDLSVSGDTVGPFELNRPDCDPVTHLNCLGAGFFDGYFARVPSAWQAALGGPILNGNCCLGVIGRTSFGPALFAMDPAKLGVTQPLPAKPLVYYPEPHPLLEPGIQPCLDRTTCNPFVDGWSANGTLFNGVTEVRGAVFPEGTRSVLLFGRHGGFGTSPNVPGSGAFCYGFGTADPALVGTIPPGETDHYCYDPEDGSKGVHGYPYRYYVWAYDANDLASAAAGQIDPWTVRPYAVWPLTLPFATTGSTHLGGAAYDPQTGRVFVSQYQGDSNLPLIHVLKLQSASCTPASGSRFPVGTTTVACTATDRSGNQATGSFTVTVNLIDVTAPVVTVPANATVEATSPAGATYAFTASATDNVDGPLAATCTPASGATFTFGATTVSCSATDAHGNTGTASFVLTVSDTTRPVVTVPANATVEATGPTGAPFTFTASATDNINGVVVTTCNPVSGSTFPIGTTTVTCTAADAHGNVGTGSFTVTVTDTTGPSITVPANATVEATGPTGAAFSFTTSATDTVDGARVVTCTPASGATFAIGTTTVTCSATDAHANSATKTFTVTVRDTTAPSLTLPANMTAEATSATGAIVTFSATASDLVDGAVSVSCTPASGATFAIGATTVTCTARDARANIGTGSFTVTVRDTTAPVVTVPANATVEATGPTGAAFSFATSATDTVDGALAVTCTPPSGATFAIGTTTVTCRATDARGNVGTKTFTVTVRDTTPPTLTLPANIVVDATSGAGAVVTYIASAVDTVDGSIAVTCVPASGVTFAIGTTTVNCTATDTRTNTRSGSFTVTVNNVMAPPTVTLTAPANGATASGASVTVSAIGGATVVGVQFKLDGLNLGVEDTTTPYSIVWNTTSTANGAHSLSAVARDASGRTATSTVNVTVSNATGAVDLAVDGNQKFQTISGFQVNANSASWNNGQLAPALDMLIDQGVSIFRVIIDKEDWESTNDNADPNVFNWTFYNSIYTTTKFENLWSTIGYLNSKGIASGILLNFMGPGPAWMGAPKITVALEDEWVEMIASLVYYAKVTRNLQFTLLAPTNEVDWDGIEGPQVDEFQYARLLHKLSVKLDGLGLTDIRFVGPDTAQVTVGVNNYFPQLMADPVVMAKIQHFGLHNYADLSGNADAVIKASAFPTRDFWMTEAGMGNDYYGPDHLLSQMKNGASSAGVWDAYTSVYNHRANDGNPMIDLVNTTWVPRQSFFGFKQLFKFAQPGATRIGATTSTTNLLAVAFYNQSTGQVTVVGHNQTGSRTLKISLANLPVSGTMQLYATDLSRQFARQPDVSVVNGVITIPVELDEYFTLTALATPDTTPPTVAMTAPANGATVSGLAVTVSANAADNVALGGVQFKLDGANLGAEVLTSPYSITWNTTAATNGPHTLTAVARDMSGNTTTATAVSITVNNPVDVTPPTVSMTAPANGATVSGSNVTVSATAADDVGVVGVQFLLDGAPLGAEVTSAPYTLAWDATAVALGSHTLSARARDASGKQTTSTAVTITVAAPPPGVLAIDATASGTVGSPMTAIASSTFSTTSANELLLAFIGADDATPGNSVTSVAGGGGLTWVLVVRTNTQRGTAEIWRAFASAPLTNVAVTANLAQAAAGLITVVTFTGVDTTGTNGSGAIGAIKSANGASGAQTGSVTTTRANSWVWGTGNDWASAISRTIGAGQTMVQEYLAPVGDTYWVQRRTATTPTIGTVVTINDTAPTTDIWNVSICEILPRP